MLSSQRTAMIVPATHKTGCYKKMEEEGGVAQRESFCLTSRTRHDSVADNGAFTYCKDVVIAHHCWEHILPIIVGFETTSTFKTR
jgi:hypothetical protein